MDAAGQDTALVRVATQAGRMLGAWRRRRLAAKQDAVVETWKAAWTEGCEQRWQGATKDAVPYKRGDRRSAWEAGWLWADGNPDRRDPDGLLNGGQRRPAGQTRLARAARRGATGLTLLAAARWLWSRAARRGV
jgi:hypothetical protein